MSDLTSEVASVDNKMLHNVWSSRTEASPAAGLNLSDLSNSIYENFISDHITLYTVSMLFDHH